MKKTLKIVAMVAVVGAVLVLALELRQAQYELRLDRALITDWNETATLQRAAHVRVLVHDRQEIARLQATNAVVAAH